MQMRVKVFLFVVLLFFRPAEARAESFTYAPATCDFTVTFPGQPDIQEVCENGQCYDQVTFIKVFDMDASLSFSVTCSAVNEDTAAAYTPDVMRTTVRAMSRGTGVERFETNILQEDKYRMASLIGEGLSGRVPMIYIGQLWIGESSAFVIKAELVGPQHEEADRLFSDVLRSARLKPPADPEATPESESAQP